MKRMAIGLLLLILIAGFWRVGAIQYAHLIVTVTELTWWSNGTKVNITYSITSDTNAGVDALKTSGSLSVLDHVAVMVIPRKLDNNTITIDDIRGDIINYMWDAQAPNNRLWDNVTIIDNGLKIQITTKYPHEYTNTVYWTDLLNVSFNWNVMEAELVCVLLDSFSLTGQQYGSVTFLPGHNTPYNIDQPVDAEHPVTWRDTGYGYTWARFVGYGKNIWQYESYCFAYGVSTWQINFATYETAFVNQTQQSSSTATWDIIEGCGDSYLNPDNVFSMSVVAVNGFQISNNVIGAFNDTISFDSYGHCFISGTVPVYTVQLSKPLENYSIAELVSELASYKKQFTVIAGDFPQLHQRGVSGVYANNGWTIVKDFSVEVLAHELAHGFGFCDPDPYGEAKQYWRDKYGNSYSQFSNSTWFYYNSNTGYKLWITLKSQPVLSCGNPGYIKLSFRGNKQFSITAIASCSNCSIYPETTTIQVSTIERVETWTITPPMCNGFTTVLFTLHIESYEAGLNRWLNIPIMVLGSDIPGYNSSDIFANDDFWQQLLNATNTAWSSQYTHPDAIRNAQVAEQDFENALRCYRKAQNVSGERASLYLQAAQLWFEAGHYRLMAADSYEARDTFFGTRFWGTGKHANEYERLAEATENKARQLELSADYFGGSTILPGLWLLFQSGTPEWLDTVGKIMTIIGILLTIVGLIYAVVTKGRDRGKIFMIGVVLLIIGIVLWAL